MADDLKLLVPWSFWYIPLKDRTSFQKIKDFLSLRHGIGQDSDPESQTSPAKVDRDVSFAHIFLLDFFNIFFDRPSGTLCKQLCG